MNLLTAICNKNKDKDKSCIRKLDDTELYAISNEHVLKSLIRKITVSVLNEEGTHKWKMSCRVGVSAVNLTIKIPDLTTILYDDLIIAVTTEFNLDELDIPIKTEYKIKSKIINDVSAILTDVYDRKTKLYNNYVDSFYNRQLEENK